ncbi:hypothetical protein CVT26_003624 [Gymnopilus dilepis]|uniref:Hydrophobin n=1 Tax=Gymnopilus dilepis TaxID=231916 RepID=A0A409VR50_9AGAR|nr:hypothetical protein CVT26_003624 [Gymnopilus dilepis]
MQFKLASVLALATLAAANPVRRGEQTTTQCTTGSLQCCESVEQAGKLSTPVTTLLGLLGIVVQGVTAMVGVTCSPVTVIGTGGTSCSEQPVCCTNNSFNGLVALGCSPLNANL